MGKVIQFPPERAEHNKHWNQGYSDGYQQQRMKHNQADAYYEGYKIGCDDREEDEEAIASGDLENLAEAERRLLYGDESDRV